MNGAVRQHLRHARSRAVLATIKWPPDVPELPRGAAHGTEYGYVSGCRCDPCCDGARAARARRAHARLTREENAA